MHTLADADDAARTVDYWAAEGVTSFKAYNYLTADELKAAIDHALLGVFELSSPGEFHPEALPEPYVSLSAHTAPMVKTSPRCRSQRARRVGCRSMKRTSQPQARTR
jgi:hypothetical protein